MTERLNRHSKILFNNNIILKNNVKFDRNVKKLKYLIKQHNYKILAYPDWKIKVLKKLGRNYRFRFKKSPFKRKFYLKLRGYFNLITRTLSAKSFVDFYNKNNTIKIYEDYENETEYYKLFFFNQGAKALFNARRRLKYFRKKIVIRKILAKRLGIRSNQRFYHIHKKYKNKKDTVLRWINTVESRLENFIMSLGWARNIREAKLMVWDGRIYLNGSRRYKFNRSVVKKGDNFCLPKLKYWYKKRRFFSRLFNLKMPFVDWYKHLLIFFPNKNGFFNDISINFQKNQIYKHFLRPKSFERKFLDNFELLSSNFFKKNSTLVEFSNKKVSVSLCDQLTFHNFLPLYKSRPVRIKKKLIDFFLHSYYF